MTYNNGILLFRPTYDMQKKFDTISNLLNLHGVNDGTLSPHARRFVAFGSVAPSYGEPCRFRKDIESFLMLHGAFGT